MTTIETNLQAVRQRIAAACAAAGRDAAQVQLLAVSKTFPAASVSDAIAAGQLQFGENYIQEAVAKIEALPRAGITWHCIGPVQSNKTRLVAEHFDWLQSLDRLKIAQRLNELPDADGLKDAKTRLQEWMQSFGLGLPTYEVLEVSGAQHNQQFRVACRVEGPRGAIIEGWGRSRRKAEQAAAELMLSHLQSHSSES